MISLVSYEKTWRRGRRYMELAFVAAVTAVLLALVARETRHGLEGLPGMLVYAFAAGFGLEFVSAAWRGKWRPRGQGRQLHR